MSELTYLIGAGASAGQRNLQGERISGVPVVCEIAGAIEKEIEKLLSFSSPFADFNAGEYELTESQCTELISALRRLQAASSDKETIDHYAKELLLLKQIDTTCGVDSNNPYKYLKRLLAIFILMVQNKDTYDKRYEIFLQEVLTLEKKLPYLTMLSWNYDAQFELAYANYTENKYILQMWDKINVYNKTCSTNFRENNPFALIKLNGTAFFRDYRRKTSEFKAYYIVPDIFYGGYGPKDRYSFFYDMLTQYFQECTLSYAWEEDSLPELLDVVRQRVCDTKMLVVIGYSFPKFNKTVDKKIFEAMPSLRNVVIQDRNEASCNEVEKHIRCLVKSDDISYEHVTDTSKFYVPYEFDLDNQQEKYVW